jgi:hypothetical protein
LSPHPQEQTARPDDARQRQDTDVASTAARLLPVTSQEMLQIATAQAQEDQPPPVASYPAMRAAEDAIRAAARRRDPKLADLASAMVLVLLAQDGYVGRRRDRFVRACLELLAEVNGCSVGAADSDIDSLLSLGLDAHAHPNAKDRASARERLHSTLRSILLTQGDTGDWSAPPPVDVPSLLVLCPDIRGRGSDSQPHVGGVRDLAVLAAARLRNTLGWHVRVHDLSDGRDRNADLSTKDVRGIVVFGHPPGQAVCSALERVPADAPTLVLIPAGEVPSRIYDSGLVRHYVGIDDLADHLDSFANALRVRVHLRPPGPTPPAAATQPDVQRAAPGNRPQRRSAQDEPLPGFADGDLLGSFEVWHSDASVRDMLEILDRTDWREHDWLGRKELAAAKEAAACWPDADYHDALAYARMEKAYEHHAPLAGIPTRKRNLTEKDHWEALRRSRRRG